ncbi:hypothetical protein R1sor_015192 [Riccia sorocarpa]|uniref:Reverse transcriptase domain-containing protein n=1 Tax=Riccia sorocarpa TaxID=122646 RepID=A0ABD3HC24_9MARC
MYMHKANQEKDEDYGDGWQKPYLRLRLPRRRSNRQGDVGSDPMEEQKSEQMAEGGRGPIEDAQIERNASARNSMLAYVNTKVSSQQNEELIEAPSMDELKDVVKRLPSEKAPGLDGPTAYLCLMLGVHEERMLSYADKFLARWDLAMCDSRGVIKLLPKNHERKRLRNWHPITLLTLTYKLNSKTLAGRLKKILLNLVDEHQTGFVDGRSIHNPYSFTSMQKQQDRKQYYYYYYYYYSAGSCIIRGKIKEPFIGCCRWRERWRRKANWW